MNSTVSAVSTKTIHDDMLFHKICQQVHQQVTHRRTISTLQLDAMHSKQLWSFTYSKRQPVCRDLASCGPCYSAACSDSALPFCQAFTPYSGD